MYHRRDFFVAFTALAIGMGGGVTANAQYQSSTYYSAPAYSYGPVSNGYYGNPYGAYNHWFTGPSPTFRDFSAANAANRGPNVAIARARNQATGLTPQNGLIRGFRGGSRVSAARKRDDILRVEAFTQARGLTFRNGPVRGLWALYEALLAIRSGRK